MVDNNSWSTLIQKINIISEANLLNRELDRDTETISKYIRVINRNLEWNRIMVFWKGGERIIVFSLWRFYEVWESQYAWSMFQRYYWMIKEEEVKNLPSINDNELIYIGENKEKYTYFPWKDNNMYIITKWEIKRFYIESDWWVKFLWLIEEGWEIKGTQDIPY